MAIHTKRSRPGSHALSIASRHPVAVLALAIALAPGRADAYLDPGTGSMILQATLATIMGALLILKTYWRRIRSAFSRKQTDPSGSDERSAPERE